MLRVNALSLVHSVGLHGTWVGVEQKSAVACSSQLPMQVTGPVLYLEKDRMQFRKRITGLCQCHGSSVAGLGSMAMAMEWRPAVEQVMLVTSVALAYVAGIATPAWPTLTHSPFKYSSQNLGCVSEEESMPLQQFERSEKVPAQSFEMDAQKSDPWVTAEEKLAAALMRLAHDERDTRVYEDKEGPIRSPMLSLQAISAGPRLRLLVRSLENLRKEVDSISEASLNMPSGQWTELSLCILSQSIEPICRTWLDSEACLLNEDRSGLSQMGGQRVIRMEDSKNDTSEAKEKTGDLSPTVNLSRGIGQGNLVLNYLQKSGKAELYMDLLFFLRFQTMRPGSCCNYYTISTHVGSALEDLIVAIADCVAAIYLGRSSEMRGYEESDWPFLVRPSIKSTRALERFRNEVALHSWLQWNLSSVAAMFEDRFELWTIQSGSSSKRDSVKGRRKGVQGKDGNIAEDLKLKRSQLPARRSKELSALTGWRYFYSLYLEFSDIVGPLLQVLITKLGDAVSFLLVCLIGRSLGLIYQGIRQSVSWSSK